MQGKSRVLHSRKKALALAVLCAALEPALGAEPSVTGQTGLISMPDARFAPEGSWRTGLSFMRPYEALWSGITMFPWLEGSFRYTRIFHTPGFSQAEDPNFGTGYGDFKDKSFDTKLRLLPERGWWPSVALGVQDVGGGTGIFRAPYGVASKQVGELDFTLGYGTGRIDGLFGGARWTPQAAPNWSVVAEYDAYNYARDVGSSLSGAGDYKKSPALGVEYRQDSFGVKLFSAHGKPGFNAYVSVPLEKREFVPKIDEPAPYTRINPRPTQEQWRDSRAHRARLARALVEQDFREISLGYEHGRLEATLTNSRISSMPRAVGRAARTLLSFAPLEVREIRVTYLQGTLPVVTYTFINVPLLQRYFNGMASREQLAPYVAIEYADPARNREELDRSETLAAFDEPLPEGVVIARDGADVVALRGENVLGGRLLVRPGLSTYLNDPSGAFKFEVSAIASYDRAIGEQLFLVGETKLTLYEDVSDVTQPSNSTLPHVRSDVAEYKRASRFKMTRLLVNKFYQPAERVYGRLSGGIYEEMFGGAGGQLLYMPAQGNWGVDIDANWLRQRDFEGWLGVRDYSTVTALASLNYRMAQGVTGTLRVGRFLAKDEGVRAELKRRFASGVEVGAWYTVTNGRDITSPGSPSSPYYDKGIFMSIPLETLLTRDNAAVASFALAPWTRDVGQMVASPGDLYRIVERPVRQMRERDGLAGFGDRDDDYNLPSLGTGRERIWPDFAGQDLFSARRAAGGVDWLQTAALGGAMLLGAAAFDNRAENFAERHKDSKWSRQGVRFGNALPLGALGLSALAAFDDSRPRLSDAGVAALEAGGLALVATEALKYGLGRSRPSAGEGSREFHPGATEDRRHSFPSRHSAVMWAAVTPYAEEFDLPALYALAAVTSAARVGSREHWLSDSVGGALLGYGLGHLAWQARRDSRRSRNVPAVAVGPRTVTLSWTLE